MLYDLTFLEKGKPWPPEEEIERLDAYEANRALFKGEHAKIYIEQFKRIERVIGNFDRVISYPIILNYHRLVSLKVADLIFSEPPKITVPDDASQKKLDAIMKATDIHNVAYTSAIDASRYGDAVLTKTVQNGAPKITASSPDYWFPVVERSNINNRLFNVQGWVYPIDAEQKRFRLKVTIYSPKTTEQIEYDLVNGVAATNGQKGKYTIDNEVTGSRKTLKEEDAKSVLVTAHNLLTTDSIHGTSDYDIFDSILSEIMVRVSQVSKVLDKHTDPTMSGPEGALDYTDQKNPTFKSGNYLPRASNEEPDVNYHTWDAALSANFEQIKLLMHNLYTLSEMGSVLLGDFSTTTGAIPSGTALRRLMMSPLAKAARVRNSYDKILKTLLSACMQDVGENIEPEAISIAWNDGLPKDPAEEAAIMSTRTGGKATKSQWSAIKQLDNLSEEDIQTEIDMIRSDDDIDGMTRNAGVSTITDEDDESFTVSGFTTNNTE